MLLFVPPSKQKAVKDRLRELIHVPFKFEFLGSQIIFCDHEQGYVDEDLDRRRQEARPFRELAEEHASDAGTEAAHRGLKGSGLEGGIR